MCTCFQLKSEMTENQESPVETSCALSVASNHAAKQYLTLCAEVERTRKASLQEIIQRSAKFPIKFPVISMLCQTLLRNRKDITSEQLEQYVNSAYPVLHEAALNLYINFLEHKKKYGTELEKKLYDKMGLIELVQRILHKRAVSFYGRSDKYTLLSGEGGYGHWEEIGRAAEKPPLVLANCLSYDEIKLSAFLSVSSQSFFINDGNRDNRGKTSSDRRSFQNQGIIMGVIGARLESGGLMEWQELVVSPEQNTKSNGYGRLEESGKYHWRKVWADFYGVSPYLPVYEETLKSPASGRYTRLPDKLFFDNIMYKKRVTATAETLLLEAERRAAIAGTNAYINVVGFGLGVWRKSSCQEKLFLDAFADCLKRLSPVLLHVSDVHFIWFKIQECGGVTSGNKICERENSSGIRIHFSMGSPHARLIGEDSGKLLVASYAWDGNALPGNEFWEGMLAASGDPAAACSTQITELHNPHVNPVMISGSNLHVASPRWGVMHITEYARRKLMEYQ